MKNALNSFYDTCRFIPLLKIQIINRVDRYGVWGQLLRNTYIEQNKQCGLTKVDPIDE